MSGGAPPVVVVGGGLAGIAAAAELARAGHRTQLHERRRALGGRASSFRDPVEKRLVDNGQHVLLGACAELRGLMDFLGVGDRIAWRDQYHLWCPLAGASEGVRATLRPAAWLPSRIRYLPSLLGLRILGFSERLAVARGLAAIARLSEAELAALDGETFEMWLRRHGQPPRAVSRFWAPVIVSALNESIDRASARAAAWIFLRGFLGSPDDVKLGIPRAPLGELFDAPSQEKLGALGVELSLGSEVEQVAVEEGRAAGAIVGGRLVPASAVILAVPWTALPRLLGPEAMALDPQLSLAAALEPSPIVSVHFFFGSEVSIEEQEIALVESRAQWIFDRFAATGREEDRGHLVIVVSAARELARLPRDRIESEMLADLRAVVPSARARAPRRTLVVTEWEATYSAAVETERRRPAAETRIGGLFLAGDACASGWPATMEGAVRAGLAAARAAAARLGSRSVAEPRA